jgi:hypothetical protein
MTTKAVSTTHRLSHWAGIMRERKDSGLSIRAYCKRAGYHENNYYYWQRKLREAGAYITEASQQESLSTGSVVPSNSNLIPSGWTLCSPSLSLSAENTTPRSGIKIEVNSCQLTVTPDTDMDLLSKVCRTLVNLC